MKKTLIYTTCDFSPQSYQCTEFLYRSLMVYNSEDIFDFCVISNKINPECIFPIILIDNKIPNNLSTWKYTQHIPKGYERYFYLDSDILCFGKIDDMFNESNFSFITETHPMSDSDCYCYKYATTEEKLQMKNYNGFCAGSFGFKNIKFLSDILNLMKQKLSNTEISDNISIREKFDLILPDALLDQTSFNYWIFKQLPELKYCDLSNKCVIRPDGIPYTSDKTIYHFCGFQYEMVSKYNRMKHFCHVNNIEI